MILVLALVVGVLFTGGTYLLLQRTLTRTILGLVLYGHAVNVLLLLAGGRAGAPPLVDGTNEPIADPLTEAMAQSGHRSVSQAASYYNDAERKLGRAARLIASLK